MNLLFHCCVNYKFKHKSFILFFCIDDDNKDRDDNDRHDDGIFDDDVDNDNDNDDVQRKNTIDAV